MGGYLEIKVISAPILPLLRNSGLLFDLNISANPSLDKPPIEQCDWTVWSTIFYKLHLMKIPIATQ